MGEISEIVDGILYLEAAKFVTARSFTSTAGKARARDREAG
jgi:hypothetical protein